jgi:malate dehydrogenase (oxaloacetate-decarboxylating)(NADP+)
MSDFRQQALDYHSKPTPGKISIALSKPAESVTDLALAYSPGVAEPVREIAADPDAAYKYTGKGNLVAVISNGTAILGLLRPNLLWKVRHCCSNVSPTSILLILK